MEGAFREDLFFRLNVISVEMPPLCRRYEDLIHFANHYLYHFAGQCGRSVAGFSDEAISCIRSHSWPGNLRELRNAIERAVILTRDTTLQAADLPTEIQSAGMTCQNEHRSLIVGAMISLDRVEEEHIRWVLKQTKSLAEAAEVLGIDQTTLFRKRKRIGLE